MTSVLLATVGGSHQPIVTAIQANQPDYVTFFCTDRDSATGKAGSRAQVEGTGSVIKADPKDAGPTLPNVVVQCALAPDVWEIRIVPADDLDRAFSVMRMAVAELRARFPAARLIADYTGGTKTMTAALVLCALDSDIELTLVTGSRADLVRVADGTQSVASAAVEGVRLSRAMQPYLDAWTRFAYAEAHAGLAALPAPRETELRAHRDRARDLSAAFAAWDRFDHAAAGRMLHTYANVAAPVLRAWYAPLRLLAGAPGTRRTGMLIWDLWLNAQRRAHDGRYDDAVARAYRMIEWTAQWLLESRAGLSTGDLPGDAAASLGIAPGRDGRSQAGLWAAWQLVEQRIGGAPGQFFASERGAMLAHLQRRNGSILAHGFDPIDRSAWESLHEWLKNAFVPMLEAELAATGLPPRFPQLPQTYPWKVWAHK